MIRILRFISPAFFIFFTISAQAQVTANFTTTSGITSGCAPYVVNFLNTSSPATGVTYGWTFGNGNTSTLKNPIATYQNPGVYTVKLKVCNGNVCDSITKTNYITVFANPTANFSSSSAGACQGQPISFTDISVPGTAPINQWNWILGGGASSNLQNPTQVYNQIGTYNVSLTVTDTNGCTSSKTINNFITIVPKPTANFITTPAQTDTCAPPYTVGFTSTSDTSAGGPFTYLWNFGDATTSAQQNPSHTYTTFGQFTVKLVVTNSFGCKDSITVTNKVRIGDVTAGFTMSADTVCPNQSILLNSSTSVGAQTYQWSSTGGTFSSTTAAAPTVTYSTTGNHIIQLIAIGPGGACKDTVTDTVHVQLVTADFTNNPAYGCSVPLTVQYTNTSSSNITSSQWLFGNGNISSSQNPSNIYTAAGSYSDTLIVTTAYNCTATIIKTNNVIINIITPDFFADTLEGCVPVTSPFHATGFMSLPGNVSDSIATYQWNFGDGAITLPGAGAATVTGIPNTSGTYHDPVHVYNNSGEYTVTLIITTTSGCTDSIVKTNYIQIGSPQIPDFTVDIDTACADSMFSFTDLSQDQALIDEWHWSVGGYPTPDISEFSSQQNGIYNPTDTGLMYIQLVIGYHKCYDTLLKDSFIYVAGPYIPSISHTFDCADPYTYEFTQDTSKGVEYFTWDFGDASPFNTTDEIATHTYAATGDYTIEFQAFNDNAPIATAIPDGKCKYFRTDNIMVRDIIAEFTMDTTWGCVPLTIQFNGSPSQDESIFMYPPVNGNAGFYQWNFGDSVIYSNGTTDTINMDTVITHTFNIRDERNVQLIITDVNGCKDTVVHTIKAYKPYALFEADVLSGCVPLLVNFTDTSESDTTIVAWQWDLGESGVTDVQQNTTYSYTTIGTKNVRLIVTDTIGCKDTLVKSSYITPLQPVPSWIITDNTLCDGVAAIFTNNTTYPNGNINNVTYQWIFDYAVKPNDTVYTTSPNFVFSDTGFVTITLTATDAVLGCDSTVTINNNAQVQPLPVAGFYADPTDYNCYPVSVQFYDTSVSAHPLTSYFWNSGAGTSPLPDSVSFSYNIPGPYTVQLIVSTAAPFSCTDTVTKPGYININGPISDMVVSPDTICRSDSVQFVLLNPVNVGSFQWDFGDGGGVFDTDVTNDTVYHLYEKTGYIYIFLIVYSEADGSGCTKPYIDSIYIHEVFAGYSYTPDTIGCIPFTVSFADTSVGSNASQWNFGNGVISTDPNPTQTYENPGTYIISLSISNTATGCVDSVRKGFHVYPLPVTNISADTVMCKGDEVQLIASGTGNSTFSWDPGATLNDSDIFNPMASPPFTETYSVLITDTNNCSATESVSVTVYLPPSVTTIPDTSITIGEEVTLYSTTENAFTISWTPADSLSCSDCLDPVAQPTISQTYTISITDDKNCFVVSKDVFIEVINQYSVDVPSAFTPNGDGNNDTIYVRGWGIKDLLTFQIYNRWGQLVFETSDLKTGWDGTFKGQAQNVETYAYLVSVEYYDGHTEQKKGYITLIH